MGVTATMAIITGLCGFRRRRPPDSPPPGLSQKPDIQSELMEKTQEATAIETDAKTGDNNSKQQMVIKELPPPPGMMMKDAHSCNNFTLKSDSTRKLGTTLSVKSISVKIREKKAKPKDEDSIWKKTIILGGKCKISDDDNDAVIFNGKHDTVLAYHPRTLSTISISRTGSFKESDKTASRMNSFKD
ncbi:hypothetical protein Gogos_007494 [Gossypium gossypioides]|uniref:Uncharacterized protein n=1 Tax=Gossypium gossypioides TaxID=34282 RepID=A0A7J9C8S2_GOSGO|nr:hypothetical protein [Gossypium gossypioides]